MHGVPGRKPKRPAGGARPWLKKWLLKANKIRKALKEEALKAGREDPRKVVHSLKAGLALTAASLLYLLEPVYNGMGQNSIWAVLTVILVLEFTAGATLSKGINRGLGTVVAVCFALLMEIFAHHIGHIGRAIYIGFSVFLVGAFATYARFIPSMKKHFDHGLIVFLVTYNLVAVGSYHADNMLRTAVDRIYSIGIGCGICLITSLFIFPNWSGEDLESSIISKFEQLAKSVQGCVNEYFQEVVVKATSKSGDRDPLSDPYEEALDCSSEEESLAKFASWEPRHSRYCYPWKQYMHLGLALRHLGYTVVALHGCVESHIQAPKSIRPLFRQPCEHVAEELVKVLKELGDHVSPHISDHLHEALQELDTSIKSQPQLFLTSKPIVETEQPSKSIELVRWKQFKRPQQIMNRTMSKTVITYVEFSEALPLAAFVCLLVEMVARLDIVIEEVEELEKFSHFEEFHDEDIEIVVVNEGLDFPL